MPKEKNRFVRVLVPVLLILVGIGVFAAVLQNTSRRSAAPAQPTPGAAGSPQQQVPTPQAVAQPPAPVAPGPVAPGPTEAQTPALPAGPARALTGLRAKEHPGDPRTRQFASIGSLDPDAPVEALVEFTPLGAGVKSVALAEHFETIKLKTHDVIQRAHVYQPPAGADGVVPPAQVIAPMSLVSVEINGQQVSLVGAVEREDGSLFGAPVWVQTSPGEFEATIENDQGETVAVVRRRYELEPGSYVIRVRQGVENLSGQPMVVRWSQFGPVELPQGRVSYGGDVRRVRFGYMLQPSIQRQDPTISTRGYLRNINDVLGKRIPPEKIYYNPMSPVWPDARATAEAYRIVWAGMTSRYFAAAVHPLLQPGATNEQRQFRAAATIDRVLLQPVVWVGGEAQNDPIVALRTTSESINVPPAGTADLSMGYYAGPLSKPVLEGDAAAATVGLDEIVIYTFGGPCAFCTFEWLTTLLLALLKLLHSAVFDWAIAIILLVLIVRTLLHPVTKWSQIRMQRFGRQMQNLAPKQKKLQEKYGNDQQKMREEMAKLWREEGISPTGALGCIPMLLQTPVWIALYATLFFAIELRHQPAFYGIFQAMTPGYPQFFGWFLGDLAEPDRLWYFGHTILTIPLFGQIDSLNLLPFILALVFYMQQKYLTPPPSATMTPEQEQQQKIMKVMMVVLFPVIMYNAPSGLALYFIANSTLGILESRWIRRHIDEHDLLNPEKFKKTRKPGGFMERLQKLAEERQKQMMKAKGMQPPRKKV